MPLQASPAMLLSRLAPSGFAYGSCLIRACFALTKIKKKSYSVSQLTENALKRIEIKKKQNL